MKKNTFYLPRNIIHERVLEVADAITCHYKHRHPDVNTEGIVIVSILKGAIFFTTDLIRILYNYGLRTDLEFIGVRSYEGATTNNNPRQYLGSSQSLKMRHILLIDDIVDTGQTLYHVQTKLKDSYKPKTFHICVFLDKPLCRQINVPIDFYGFKIPNIFVVGYGLDYNEKYRCLGHIQEIDPTKIDVRD